MMKLESMEDFPACKGKRTKRPSGEYSNSLVSSPTTSSGMSTTTEEDEDMANCLILLARGNSPSQTATKFTSRRLAEIATTTNGKVGISVYECKTCNRTFPSFQALGGHRASHKRPKTAADDDHKKSPPDNQEDEKRRLPPPPSTQLLTKIHECSICGSEFASGQALGGHMRRHRPAPNGTASHDAAEKPRNVFALDLNLPAPPEDEKFQQFPAKQQPQIVFSAAPLVDCHY